MPSTLCLAHPVHSHALVSPLHLHVLLLGRLLPLLPLLHVPLCCPRTTPLVLVVGGVVARDPGADEVSKRGFPVRPKTSPLISTRPHQVTVQDREGSPVHLGVPASFSVTPWSWSRNPATTGLEEGVRDRTVGGSGC